MIFSQNQKMSLSFRLLRALIPSFFGIAPLFSFLIQPFWSMQASVPIAIGVCDIGTRDEKEEYKKWIGKEESYREWCGNQEDNVHEKNQDNPLESFLTHFFPKKPI